MNAALKARFNPDSWFSIPDITLVEIDAVSAQQLAVFLLKCASAMVLLLCLDVLQHGLKLAGAHRKRGIAALPEKAAIARVKLFDPFRGRFLYLLDQLSLGNSSRQRRDNMNVISNTADAHEFGADIAANRRQIRMHAWTHVGIEPKLAFLRAENDVKDDFTEGLRHGAHARTK